MALVTETRRSGLRVISNFFGGLSKHGYKNVVYRGHGDHRWKLTPSAFREGAKGIRNEADLQRWMDSASRFAQPRPQNGIEWLALAQHYGIATPLLDWTSSPLVALFFACEPVGGADGEVVMVTHSAFQRWYHLDMINTFSADRQKPGLFSALSMNDRALAQDSSMSLHTGSSNDNFSERDIKRVFRVPSSEKRATREALALLGFTQDRLFSDISFVVQRFKKELQRKS